MHNENTSSQPDSAPNPRLKKFAPSQSLQGLLILDLCTFYFQNPPTSFNMSGAETLPLFKLLSGSQVAAVLTSISESDDLATSRRRDGFGLRRRGHVLELAEHQALLNATHNAWESAEAEAQAAQATQAQQRQPQTQTSGTSSTNAQHTQPKNIGAKEWTSDSERCMKNTRTGAEVRKSRISS